MRCKDCGGPIRSGQEYCSRCGADLFKRRATASVEHSIYFRLSQFKNEI